MSIVNHKKNSICFDALTHIRLFAELGATERLFSTYWVGSYKGIIESASKNAIRKFTTIKSPKVNSTSWVNNKNAENSAYILAKMYARLVPENKLFTRDPDQEELLTLTIAYNTKFSYSNVDALVITQVHSLLMSLRDPLSEKGLSIFNCGCKNHYIARSTSAPVTCPWCRSKIEKSAPRNTHIAPFKVDMSNLSKSVPVPDNFHPSFS
jgi:hypothetical protein